MRHLTITNYGTFLGVTGQRLIVEEKGEKIAIKEMRKHLAYYIKNMKDASRVREKINTIDTKQELIDCLNEYFKNI